MDSARAANLPRHPTRRRSRRGRSRVLAGDGRLVAQELLDHVAAAAAARAGAALAAHALHGARPFADRGRDLTVGDPFAQAYDHRPLPRSSVGVHRRCGDRTSSPRDNESHFQLGCQVTLWPCQHSGCRRATERRRWAVRWRAGLTNNPPATDKAG